MEIQLKIAGLSLVFLGLLHLIFPSYFKWKDELARLSLINKQLMEVHTFFIAFFVLMIGLLSFTSSVDLISTRLGSKICYGISMLWFLRLIFQLFVYSPKLWKGKKFETSIHLLFILLWSYLSILYFLAAKSQ